MALNSRSCLHGSISFSSVWKLCSMTQQYQNLCIASNSTYFVLKVSNPSRQTMLLQRLSNIYTTLATSYRRLIDIVMCLMRWWEGPAIVKAAIETKRTSVDQYFYKSQFSSLSSSLSSYSTSITTMNAF